MPVLPSTDTLQDMATAQLDSLKRQNLYRSLSVSERENAVMVMREGKRMTDFASNDYLGLSHHPAVVKAAKQALEQYGAGAGASRLITGNHPYYEKLEAQLASYKQTEAACIFGSGYLANIGAIPALVDKDDLVLVDRLAHACILDGIKLSGASYKPFKHSNIDDLKTLLEKYRARHTHCLIITETVFSMDGDRAPVAELRKLADEYNAWLMTDDAHGLGIIAPEQGAHIQMGTLSKAVGCYGGYVCASKSVIDQIRNRARSLIFSTALPPATLAAACASLEIIVSTPTLGEQAVDNARYLAKGLGLPMPQSAIVPYILGPEEEALTLSAYLQEQDFFVPAIRPPTVSKGTSRLRFSCSALHAKAMLDGVIQAVHSYQEGYADAV